MALGDQIRLLAADELRRGGDPRTVSVRLAPLNHVVRLRDFLERTLEEYEDAWKPAQMNEA
jgi:hypothetical protein